MIRIIKSTFLVLVLLNFTGCAQLDALLGGTGGAAGLTTQEIGLGLKEALNLGIGKGADNVSKQDGFFKNQAIKILFPPEVQKVQSKLENIGLGSLTDNFVEKMNRAAEDAAKSAKPIFLSAIKNMTIQDAMNILMGPDNSATEYLKGATSGELYKAFFPVVDNSMSKLNVTQTWENVITKYNAITPLKPVNADIKQYVTNKALDGLFHMVANEEKNIRRNPGVRATDLLKRVFAKQDSNRS